AEAPDLVLFLGDYIYEHASQSDKRVRDHSDGVEATDLRTYRNRHAQYKADPDLQLLHAAAPCLVTWDDHEVQNDYADRWARVCPERLDPARSYLGMAQEGWLYGQFRARQGSGAARWNLLAQQQLMAEFKERLDNGEIAYWSDDWNGYPAARQRLLTQMRDSR